MADVKISALPVATTPLTGSEVLPIVQSGVTSQVSVANMTAGRTVSASTVLIGTTTQRTIAGQTTEFLIERPAASRAALVRNTNDVNGPIVFTAKSRGTTNGSYTVVASGDALGTWNFAGSDGTADVIAASIRADVDGTPGTNDMPGRLVFSTTADGASSPTERMRIDNAGRVAINATSNSFHRLVVRENTNSGAVALFGSSSNTVFPGLTFERTRAGTTAVQNGDCIGIIQNNGFDGTSSFGRADVAGFVDGAVSAGSVPTRLSFWTTPTGTTTAQERMRIDASGNVGIGTASPNANLDVRGTGSRFIRARSEDTTGAAIGYVGAEFGTNASLQIRAGNGYTYLVSTGATDPLLIGAGNTERMRITATGNVVAGGSVALATTATDGFLYVPTCAGVPTGTPTAITGMAPIVVNTTNNKLYFYSGGAWRDAGP